MTDRNDKLETPEGQTRSADEVRQGEIILKTKRRRAIFIGGVVAAGLIGLLGAALTYAW